MGWKGKERIKEISHEATVVLQVGSDSQVDLVVPMGVESGGWTGGEFGSGGDHLADRWAARDQGKGGIEDDL